MLFVHLLQKNPIIFPMMVKLFSWCPWDQFLPLCFWWCLLCGNARLGCFLAMLEVTDWKKTYWRWTIFKICISYVLLECHLAVLDCVSGDARLDLFGFDVIANHALATEVWADTLHLHEDPAILSLCLDDFSLEDRAGERWYGSFGGCGVVGGIGFHFLELDQKFEVWLCDFIVFFIELVGEGPTSNVLQWLQIHAFSLLLLQLAPSLVSNEVQFLEMVLVCAWWEFGYSLWWKRSATTGGFMRLPFMIIMNFSG